MDGIVGTVAVTSICAFSMVLGIVSLLFFRIPPKLEAATQNFSAGILIAAIAGELFPLLHGSSASHRREHFENATNATHDVTHANATHVVNGSKNTEETVAMLIGFCVGLLLMFGQKHIFEHDEHERRQEDTGASGGGLALLDSVLLDLDAAAGAPIDSPVDALTRQRSGDGVVTRSPSSAPAAAPSGSSLRLQRIESDRALQTITLKTVGDMKDISAKVRDILQQQRGSVRDALDDELSELHMLLGVLRRQLRGAEPMTREQLDNVVRRTAAVDTFIARLETHLGQPRISVPAVDAALSRIEDELRGIIQSNIDTVHKFRRWQPAAPTAGRKTERIPWSLVVGVSIDCLVDGLMVGLTFTASHRAGYIMALATSIESCFLGLSLSSMISNATASRVKHLGISAVPVAAMLAGGAAAGAAGQSLDKGGAPFIGFVMFAIVSLLFLVTQELLLTAHSITDEVAIWYININLFLGAGMVIFIEKLIPA